MAHQSLHVAVQGMSVVSAELGVGTLERGVARGLGLLDAVQTVRIIIEFGNARSDTNPLRWALAVWLCWELFFDSVDAILEFQRVYLRNFAATYWPLLRFDGMRSSGS